MQASRVISAGCRRVVCMSASHVVRVARLGTGTARVRAWAAGAARVAPRVHTCAPGARPLARLALSAHGAPLQARGMADDIVHHPPMPAEETSFETPLSPEQVVIARQRDYALRLKHGALPTGDESGAADIHTYRRRLIYRSRQRGWLEVDLLLGKWATENVPNLNAEQLMQYEVILNCETIDLFYFISGQKPVPDVLQSPVMTMLQEYAFANPLGKADPAAYAKAKPNFSN